MHLFVKKSTKGTRWAIPDIHGCYKTFRTLVEEEIQLTKDDQLFLLGDYIDKGKHAALVLDFIIELKENGYNIFPLKGNHEENFLEAYRDYDSKTFEFYISKLGKNKGLTENGEPFPRHLELLKSLPLVIETEDFIMVHAAIKPNLDYSNHKYVLEQYKVELTREELIGKTLLRGHQPVSISEIEKSIASKSSIISLDNGCVYFKKKKKFDTTKLGKLVAFNLDTFELKTINNCEK